MKENRRERLETTFPDLQNSKSTGGNGQLLSLSCLFNDIQKLMPLYLGRGIRIAAWKVVSMFKLYIYREREGFLNTEAQQGIPDQLQVTYPGQIYHKKWWHPRASSSEFVCCCRIQESTGFLLLVWEWPDFTGRYVLDHLVWDTFLCLPLSSFEQGHREDHSRANRGYPDSSFLALTDLVLRAALCSERVLNLIYLTWASTRLLAEAADAKMLVPP